MESYGGLWWKKVKSMVGYGGEKSKYGELLKVLLQKPK